MRCTAPPQPNAYLATIKAAPAAQRRNPHYRVRNDHVDRLGKISLRRAGRMHHLGVGAAHKGQAVTILIDADTVTVLHTDTGEVLSTHTIDPDRSYWRNQYKTTRPMATANMNNDVAVSVAVSSSIM